MDDLITQFLEHYRLARHARPGTIDRYRANIFAFFKGINMADPEAVDRDLINRHIGDMRVQGMATNTLRLRQTVIRMFYAWYCREVNPDLADPSAELVQIHEERVVPRVLSPTDLMKMVYECDLTTFIGRRDAALMCLLADTGIRLSEAVQLKIGNVQPKEDHFILLVPRTKTYERQVPFCRMKETDFVSEYWLSYWQEITLVNGWHANYPLFITQGITHIGHNMKHGAIDRMVKKYARKAGVDCSVHSFRHFFGTYSYLNGVDIVELRKLMGHALIETTMRYVHLSNIVAGKVLAKTATAGMKAPEHVRGYVRLYSQSINKC